tara:strand:+ start:2128 stop:2259 length:132 start_codon:yes stop_codon:yes gene_type:complete
MLKNKFAGTTMEITELQNSKQQKDKSEKISEHCIELKLGNFQL